ncbi:DUF4419 domain-containing protein [Aliinostoc sp. HNIBRCY26]|uniref:DUF4419 domain-containing protein n=1 Tax=Aliinostoc sp. HNIBRCY26 TaxID=3418997 RepID=UPI003D02D62B
MSVTAPILEQTVGKIRFCVDDVKKAQKQLPTENFKLRLEKHLGKQMLAFSHNDTFEIIQDQGTHSLAFAVHAAFSKHRPLLLTPDIIWITLAQGFAQHINNHAETLRSRFVRHQSKQELIVETLQIPQQPQHWSEAAQNWALLIRDHVGSDLYRLLECNFSTTTPITRTASHIVMMNSFQKYFDYAMTCICGIPEITLLGTVEDWQNICDRIPVMAEYDLDWWTARLMPICQEFVETASGRPSLLFWRSIYKPQAVYGGELITGWLSDLFPYIKHSVTKAPSVRNPVLEIDRCSLPNSSPSSEQPFSHGTHGISANSLPLGISKAPFRLQLADSQEYFLELIAGFIGVRQDSQSQTLQPEIGWAVCERNNDFAQLLDKVQQQHLTQPPINWSDFHKSHFSETVSKEHIEMLERFDGATLYANSGHFWQIPQYSFHKIYTISQPDSLTCYATHLMDLEDGRCIAYFCNTLKSECCIILGQPISDSNQLQTPVIIANSIPELFERIFQAQGHYYFDDSNFEVVQFKYELEPWPEEES